VAIVQIEMDLKKEYLIAFFSRQILYSQK
jgi:hypothetical protein